MRRPLQIAVDANSLLIAPAVVYLGNSGFAKLLLDVPPQSTSVLYNRGTETLDLSAAGVTAKTRSGVTGMDEWFGKRMGSDPPFPVQRVPLESETLRQLEVAFAPELRDEARRVLEEQCGKNIPGWEIFSIGDLRVTIIKASGGSLERLQWAVDLAKVDFRDAFSLLDGSGPEDLPEVIPVRPAPPATARRRRGIRAGGGPSSDPLLECCAAGILGRGSTGLEGAWTVCRRWARLVRRFVRRFGDVGEQPRGVAAVIPKC